MINVFEFPPNESLSKFVNFESRYGMWFLCFSDVNAFITIPRVVSDLLMFPAYLSLSPEAAVIFCLSEPAKSTKCNLGVFKTFFPSIYVFKERAIVKIEWEREDYRFMRVSPTCLFFIPVERHSNNLLGLNAGY